MPRQLAHTHYPALRAALRRACGEQVAPVALHWHPTGAFSPWRRRHAPAPASAGGPIPWHPADACLPALASGALWNLGNLGSILASFSPLGSTVGYPITQVCVCVRA